MPEGDRPTTRELYGAVCDDIADRKSFVTRLRAAERGRLAKDKRKIAPYAGAPDLVEPLVDDNVRRITSAEISILWSARTLGIFLPLTPAAFRFKRVAEAAFDTLLRLTLSARQKLENLFDTKNERGLAIARLTTNAHAAPGHLLPDFEPVDPLDLVVPSVARQLDRADRVTYVSRYTPREFAQEAARKGWRHAARIEKLARSDEGNGDERAAVTREEGHDPAFGSNRAQQLGDQGEKSTALITVWEVYHYERAGSDGAYRRFVTVFCPEWPDIELRHYAWRWPDRILDAGEVAPGGVVLRPPVIEEGDDRPWPFVAFRFENRSLAHHDVRGVADLIACDQREATAYRLMKAIFVDYTCRPFTRGPTKPVGFRWRPGDHVPDGTEFVQPPAIPQIFDYSADMARTNAAVRAGSPQGAMSSRDRSRDTKTATEVSQEAFNASQLSTDAVERFTESLSELFTQMWDWLRHYPAPLPALVGEQTVDVPLEIFDEDFLVLAGVSGKTANPDLLLRQLGTTAELIRAFPQAAPFVRGGDMAQLIFDLIDPRLTPRLVVDPTTAGPGAGVPIEQAVQQLGAAIHGANGAPGLAQQVAAQGQYLSALAQSDLVEAPREGADSAAAAPAQPGVKV